MLRHFSLPWSFALSVEIDVPWVGYPGRAVFWQHSTYQKTHGTCIGFTALFLASFQVQRQSEATTWYFDFKLIQFWASGRRNCGLSSTCLCLRFATVLKGQMSCEDVKKCAYFVCFCIALTSSESFQSDFRHGCCAGSSELSERKQMTKFQNFHIDLDSEMWKHLYVNGEAYHKSQL